MTAYYSETFFLSAGETNPEQELSLPLLVSKIIDVATAHANALGVGNPDMASLDAGWILARLTVEMKSWPEVNTEYTLTTWVISFNRHFSERAFRITDTRGNVYGYARSIWMVMRTSDRTNLGLAHLHLDPEMVSGEEVPIPRQAKHADVAPNVVPFQYTFKYCDLDSYRHVNTVRYVELLLNRFTLEQMDATSIRRLELAFLHEARYGMDTVLLQHYEPEKLLSTFQLRRSDDREPLLFARIERRKR